MNYCYLRHTECEYANGAGFCTSTAWCKDAVEYDPVHTPQHYASQSIEPIEYMRAAMTEEG